MSTSELEYKFVGDVLRWALQMEEQMNIEDSSGQQGHITQWKEGSLKIALDDGHECATLDDADDWSVDVPTASAATFNLQKIAERVAALLQKITERLFQNPEKYIILRSDWSRIVLRIQKKESSLFFF